MFYRGLNLTAFIANGALNREKHVTSGLVMIRAFITNGALNREMHLNI